MAKKPIKGIIDPFPQDEFPSSETEAPVVDALLDPSVSETLKSASKKVKKVIKCLEDIMKVASTEPVWDEKKQVDCPHCKASITTFITKLIPVHMKPIPSAVKVNAAKVWNDLVMKKVIAEKKDNSAKGGTQYNVSRAIADVARRKDLEKKKVALEAGTGKN